MKVPPSIIKIANSLKSEFNGASPAPFIGRFGYPNINIGFLSPVEKPENIYEYDHPRLWASRNYNIEKIVSFRSSLINSRQKASIKPSSKFSETIKEIGMASRPVDIEVFLKNKPKFKLQLDSFNSPRGPTGEIKKARITENPKIHSKVDKVVDDIDLKSTQALNYLFKKGFDENFLNKLLSVGTLGLKHNRKLVPTRWSITAVDSNLSKNLISEIKDKPCLDYQCYFGDYLGNYYLIMFFPDVWSYELFEMTVPHEKIWTDHEFFQGRKGYASDCVGGYYTVRLAIAEKLKQLKKQATALVFRFSTEEYSMPLGVWVTREAARKALKNKPINFSSKELMLSYAKHLVKSKFNVNLEKYLSKSHILSHISSQTKLAQFT